MTETEGPVRDYIAEEVTMGHTYDHMHVAANKQYVQEQTEWMRARVRDMRTDYRSGVQVISDETGYSASTVSSWCTGGKKRASVIHQLGWKLICQATGMEPRAAVLAYAPRGGRRPGHPNAKQEAPMPKPPLPGTTDSEAPSIDDGIAKLWQAMEALTGWKMSYNDVTSWLVKARETGNLTTEQKAELASLIFA